MGAMSACIGMINSKSQKESQFSFDSQNNFTLGDKRRRYRLQQRSNSQVFVPIKKEEEFLISNLNEENNNMQLNNKIINNEKNQEHGKTINNSFIIDNKIKKLKLRGKSNVCIKKKVLNNTDDNCDIIECEDEFGLGSDILNSIKKNDFLSERMVNYIPNQKPNAITNNIRTIKPYSIKQENGKENENDSENNNNNNNGILNDSFNNKDLNMELSVTKPKINTIDVQRSTIFGNLVNNEENGGKTLDNENNKSKKENSIRDNKKEENQNKENKLLVIKDYYEGGITNLKYNNVYKISKANNISFSDKIEGINKNIEKNNSLNVKEVTKSSSDIIPKNSGIKSSNKKKIDFNNCKIDNNINFNIDNTNLNSNNNNLNNNINNINNFNNISSINSDLNNNNFIDASSNMTYFLSLEKSHRKPTSSRFDAKVLSLRKNNHANSNASLSSKEISSNNYRNSVRVNKYKWKLLPKQKYNTQIYKSLINIPFSRDSQSLLLNDEDQKNLNLTLKYNNTENNKVISEIKKQKEQQDKVIKSLENKIKNLEKKINEEKNKEEQNNQKITKLEEFMDKNNNKKNNSHHNKEKKVKENLINSFNNNDITSPEKQKDVKIKKLEEQLNIVKKNNKLNQTLLKKKDKQIKNLIHSKNKQDEIIKQYEFIKNNSTKNNNITHNYTTKGNKKIKINFLEDNSNSITNNNLISNSNTNLTESKISLSDLRNNKNLNNSINLKINNYDYRDKDNKNYEGKKLKKYHKKENSITIHKHFFKNSSSNITDCSGFEQDNVKTRSSMRESNKLKSTKNSNIKNNKKFNASNKNSSSNISYYNYCNDLSNKSKNNYNTKITLNKMKMYRLNTSLNLTLNNENNINKLFQAPKTGTRKSKDEEINLNLEINPNTSKTARKKFSFNKSNKSLRKSSEKNLKEMYLRAGTVKNEENNANNNSSNINNVKSFSYCEIPSLTQKNSFSNGNNNLTITNKSNKDINLSLSPFFPSNFSNKNHKDNMNLEEKLNFSESLNNIHILNQESKSNLNEQSQDMNEIYKKLYDEGYLRYRQLTENTQNEENVIDELINLKFCMANELFELKVDNEDLMSDVKNKFLDIFFEEKDYGEKEKRYIDNNILFLNKEGLIDLNKKVKEINLKNNEVIIPVLKDMTS